MLILYNCDKDIGKRIIRKIIVIYHILKYLKIKKNLSFHFIIKLKYLKTNKDLEYFQISQNAKICYNHKSFTMSNYLLDGKLVIHDN